MITAVPPPPFVCLVVRVHDGDSLTCANGRKVRIAGIAAPDYPDAEPCRTRRMGYVCDARAADHSRDAVARLTLNRRLTCQPVGQSWSRIVARCRFADGRDLSCAVLATGTAAKWDRYWRAYRMGECR